MELEEARMIWLLEIGSGWVTIESLANDPTYSNRLYDAHVKLFNSDSLDHDRNRHKVRIKCKS